MKFKDIKYLTDLVYQYECRDYSKYPNPKKVKKADKAYIMKVAKGKA